MAGTTNSTNGDIPGFGNKGCLDRETHGHYPTNFYADTDGDGYGNAQSTLLACEKTGRVCFHPLDCDDSKNLRYPGQRKFGGGNGIDDNCNGQIDEFNPSHLH